MVGPKSVFGTIKSTLVRLQGFVQLKTSEIFVKEPDIFIGP